MNKQLQDGFTLIELLVVVAIIGILAAIAIPQFSAYRVRAYNAAALSDLKNAITAQEAYFADNETYKLCNSGLGAAYSCGGPTGLPGFNMSQGVMMKFTGNSSGFCTFSCHLKGDKKFAWSTGGYAGTPSQGITSSTPPNPCSLEILASVC